MVGSIPTTPEPVDIELNDEIARSQSAWELGFSTEAKCGLFADRYSFNI